MKKETKKMFLLAGVAIVILLATAGIFGLLPFSVVSTGANIQGVTFSGSDIQLSQTEKDIPITATFSYASRNWNLNEEPNQFEGIPYTNGVFYANPFDTRRYTFGWFVDDKLVKLLPGDISYPGNSRNNWFGIGAPQEDWGGVGFWDKPRTTTNSLFGYYPQQPYIVGGLLYPNSNETTILANYRLRAIDGIQNSTFITTISTSGVHKIEFKGYGYNGMDCPVVRLSSKDPNLNVVEHINTNNCPIFKIVSENVVFNTGSDGQIVVSRNYSQTLQEFSPKFITIASNEFVIANPQPSSSPPPPSSGATDLWSAFTNFIQSILRSFGLIS